MILTLLFLPIEQVVLNPSRFAIGLLIMIMIIILLLIIKMITARTFIELYIASVLCIICALSDLIFTTPYAIEIIILFY